MMEYVTEILTGGLVLVITFWLVPLQVSVSELKAWKRKVEREMPELRGLTHDEDG